MPAGVSQPRVGAAGAALLLLCAIAADVPGQAAQEVPKSHDSRIGAECRRCRIAYQKALEHTLARLPQAKYPAKMIMGWLLLADGQHPKELAQVVGEAKRWRQQAGPDEPHNHRRNWYPALAGMLLLGHDRFDPDPEVRKVVQSIVDHFSAVQERTGGWFKWHEGAYNDRPDYPVKDLEAAWDLAAKRGMAEAAGAFEAVARNHAGTRAAERAGRLVAAGAAGGGR